MNRWYFWPFHLIRDIYWCFIPLNCRECDFLRECRSGFWKGRKCYNGCIKLKLLREREREEDREDYINNLLEYAERILERGVNDGTE